MSTLPNAALVVFYCATHRTRGNGSTITIHEGRWAYCAGGAIDTHNWISIEPTSVSDLHLREPAALRSVLPPVHTSTAEPRS